MIADVIAAIGVAVAATSLYIAWRADSHAKDANTIAEEANKHAAASASAAAKSAEEAEHANKLAKVADERAQRAEARSTVRNDVRLTAGSDDQRNIVLHNAGLDTAFEVVVTLVVEKDRRVYAVSDIEGGDELLVTSLATEYAERKERRRIAAARDSAQGRLVVRTSSFTVDLHVMWRDEAGGWHGTDLEARVK